MVPARPVAGRACDARTPAASGPREADIVQARAQTEAALSRPLAETAIHFGALDDRLRRGREGWRHRLALVEASDMAWSHGAHGWRRTCWRSGRPCG